MKNLADFLTSLPDSERDYIASLDNNKDVAKHREQLDVVIAKGGTVDLASQCWHPYEVIDLGKHLLTEGHEKAFVACNGIVLLNISTGNDRCNDVDWVLPNFLTFGPQLDQDHVTMVKELGQRAKRQTEQDEPQQPPPAALSATPPVK
jgi:hypothetical protein